MLITNAIISFYCACSICCGPKAANITASGKIIKQGMVAAPRNIPFGTRVKIDGAVYTVEDRTARRYNNRFDIYTSSHQEAIKKGVKRTKIIIY